MAELTDTEKQNLLDHLQANDNPHEVTPSQSGSVKDGHTSPEIIAFPSSSRPDPGTEGRILFETDTELLKRDTGSEWETFGSAGGGSDTPYTETAQIGENEVHVFDVGGNTSTKAATVESMFASDRGTDFRIRHKDANSEWGDLVSQIDTDLEHDQNNEFFIDSTQNVEILASGTNQGTRSVGISGFETASFDGGSDRGQIYTFLVSGTEQLDDLSSSERSTVEFTTFINVDTVEVKIDADEDGTYEDVVHVDALSGTVSQKNGVRVDKDQNMALNIKKESGKDGALAIGQVK